MAVARCVDANAVFCWRTDGGELFLVMNDVPLSGDSRNRAVTSIIANLSDHSSLNALLEH